MKVTLRQMRVFNALAALGSIAKAASALGISQSTVSTTLKEMQASLKRPLFHRSGRCLKITPEGLRIQPLVRTLLLQAEEIENPGEITELTGAINVGAGDISENVLPSLVAQFREKHPGVRVNIAYGSTFKITSLLSSLAIDSLITSSLTRVPGAFLTELYRERSVFVAPPGHPLCNKPSLDMSDLADAEWCMPTRASFSNERIANVLRGHVANLRVAIEVNSDAAIREVVMAGGGIACLPRKVVEDALADGSLFELHVPGFEAVLPTYLVRMTNVQRSAAACAFDDHLIAAFAGKAPD